MNPPSQVNNLTQHPNSAYNAELSAFLDAARWISAFLVLITHVNNNLFTLLAQIPGSERNVLSYAWGFICGFAHWGVVVFFVLSGFLVGGPVLQLAIAKQKFNAKKYLVARITRIYLVLIPVLIIGKILDNLGANLFLQSNVYDEHLPTIAKQSALSVLGSILNLQGLFVDKFGSNGPLATLANEFWYYLTFPLILAPALYRKTVKGWLLFVLGLGLFSVMSLASKWHFVGFFLWITGAIFAVRSKPLILSPLVSLVIFLVIIIAIRLVVRGSTILGPYGFVYEAAIAFGFANVLGSLRFNKVNWAVLSWTGHARLSGFSYSLYAVHYPLVTFMCAALKANLGYGWHDIPKYGYHWLTALALLVICLITAWALSLLTEKNTYHFRNFIYQKIGVKNT